MAWLQPRIALVPSARIHVRGSAAVMCRISFRLILTLVLGLLGPLCHAQNAESSDQRSAREAQRRIENARQGRVELVEGDRAYIDGDFASALIRYTRAYDLIPNARPTAELRAAAVDRLCKASVERARQLAKTGQMAEADAVLDAVLTTGVAPKYQPALELREKLKDPIRYNPALTVAHTQKVDKVRRLLYEAEGCVNLGLFDKGMEKYNAVLREDEHNTAARRGMERISRLKAKYFDSARDQARAAFLEETAAAWQTAIPKPVHDIDNSDLGQLVVPGQRRATAEEKLDSIIVPSVDLSEATLSDAVDFMRQQSVVLDTNELVADRRGISFVIDLGNANPERSQRIQSSRFNLSVRDLPLRKILEYVNNATGTSTRIDDHAVVIRPLGVDGEDFITRQFRVPPDFLSTAEIGEGEGEIDPFENGAPNRGLVPRLTAGDFLRQKGVDFPDGAAATFSPTTSILTVKNTRRNMAVVEVIVEALAEAEPVMIEVTARIIRTTQERLKEVGMDWLMGAPNLTGRLFVGGGTVGNGTPFSQSTSVFPLTNGLRSGNRATEVNSIDAAIRRAPGNNSILRAPNPITVYGRLSNQQIIGVMRGVNQKKGVELMTKKSVITRSGQSAQIESIQEFIYPTEYEPPELPNQIGANVQINPLNGQIGVNQGTTPVTPANPTAFTTTNLGCMLEVLPQLGEGGYVEVAVKPTIRRFDGFINYGSPIRGGGSSTQLGAVAGLVTGGNFGVLTENNIVMPVISTVRGDTTLTILNGETVVMGGLMTESKVKVQDSLPVLGRVPLFGKLFQTDAYTSIKEAFVIMVSVRLLDPSGDVVNRR